MIEPINPWIFTHADLRQMNRFALGLLELKLLSVSYSAPQGMGGWGHAGGAFDEVHKGVLFKVATETSTEDLYVSWLMQGTREGLSVQVGGLGRGDSAIETFDVSRSSRWVEFIGTQITQVGLAFHDPDEHSPRAVWSLRLTCGSQRSVCIALGQPNADGTFGYSPDTLLVIFLPEMAKQYFVPASMSSAWGEDA